MSIRPSSLFTKLLGRPELPKARGLFEVVGLENVTIEADTWKLRTVMKIGIPGPEKRGSERWDLEQSSFWLVPRTLKEVGIIDTVRRCQIFNPVSAPMEGLGHLYERGEGPSRESSVQPPRPIAPNSTVVGNEGGSCRTAMSLQAKLLTRTLPFLYMNPLYPTCYYPTK